MSDSSDGAKPPQTGLVDMGDINFYDLINQTPSFTLSDLSNFAGSFGEIVLNVTWAELQPVAGGPVDPNNIIQNDISLVNNYNRQNHTDLGIKLRVWGGYTAPTWAKGIDGPPIVVPAKYQPPNQNQPLTQTVGRYWTADYIDAWTSFQTQLAARYDGDAVIRGISNTAGAEATDEPFLPTYGTVVTSNGVNLGSQAGDLSAAGYTNAAQQLTLRGAIADYASWATTPLDYTMNLFHLEENSGTKLSGDENFTLAVLQEAEASSRIVQAGNHALQNGALNGTDGFIYAQIAADTALDPTTVPASYQTASPSKLGGYDNWPTAIAQGVAAGAGDIELWDGTAGFPGMHPAQVQALAETLAAGTPPSTGAPDDGAALGFIAPGSVVGAAGAIAFTGVGAVLLASAAVENAYTVTVTSTRGDTLSVTNFGSIVIGPSSGPTITFAGSLDAINTVLASLTDTVPSGVDIVQIAASDSAGHTAVRSVGVQVSAHPAATDPAITPDVTPAVSGTAIYTWTGEGPDALFSDAANWTPHGGPPNAADIAQFTSASPSPATVAGTGAAATLIVDDTVVLSGGSTITVDQNATGDVDIADTPGSTGVLILGGVNTSLTIAGNLEIGGNATAAGGSGTLLAALSPSSYSTATLTVGGTIEVWDQGTARITGSLSANAIDVNKGGTISGDGTLTATGTDPIVNDGAIEAVADQTLGLQQLTLGAPVAGSGQLLIDPAATLILTAGAGPHQTVDFAPNTIAQFSDTPYSPSTLVLEKPFGMRGTITGFTFADSLVLDGVSASGASYINNTLTVDESNGKTLTFTLPSNLNDLNGLTPATSVTGTGTSATTSVTFVAPSSTQSPTVTAPAALQGAIGETVTIPDIVVQTPLPALSSNTIMVQVTLVAGTGALAAQAVGGTAVSSFHHGATLTLSGTLGFVEQTLQGLTYEGAANQTSDTITITASDSDGISVPTTIEVSNGIAPVRFAWTAPSGSSGSFGDAANWQAGGKTQSTPPGGANIATFGSGIYTVTGNGAVGQILVTGTTTLTGQVSAQGRDKASLDVDTGGALTLAGGAVLSAAQTAIVGGGGQGLLTVMGGALALTGTGASDDLVIGQSSGATGTVLDFEQIEVAQTVVVGAAGSGTLRLLGVASTVSDSGADIGQTATATSHGAVIVDGGEWTTSGQLTVGDGGAGSLLIGGSANGITGQVTAFDVTIGAQLGGQGTVTLGGGDLLVADASTATNTLAVGGGGTGTLTINNGNVTVGVAQIDSGLLTVGGGSGGTGLVTIAGNGALLVDGDASVGNGSGTGSIEIGQGPADNALLAMIGSLAIGSDGQVMLGGPGSTLRASSVSIADGGVLSGVGTVSGDGGGNSTVILTSIANSGTIAASGGNLLVYGSITGAGQLAADAGATMLLQAAVGAGQTLSFGQGAGVVLDDALAFAGTIADFAVGDTLDLASTDASGATWSANVLTIDTNTGPILLHVAGNYASNAFTVHADGLGGSEVGLPCFAAGTRILTPSGPVAVEALSAGDCVTTMTGNTRPIQWIGNRRIDCGRHPKPASVWPVRIKAGAFGPDRPIRDLFLSPDHAIYADGVLIPVKYLLNGATVRQMRTATVMYYHLELPSHDVVLAEGLPAETFLDTGNRSAFANSPGVVQLHPDFDRVDPSLVWEAMGYAPLRVIGQQVDRLRAHLAARAKMSRRSGHRQSRPDTRQLAG